MSKYEGIKLEAEWFLSFGLGLITPSISYFTIYIISDKTDMMVSGLFIAGILQTILGLVCLISYWARKDLIKKFTKKNIIKEANIIINQKDEL